MSRAVVVLAAVLVAAAPVRHFTHEPLAKLAASGAEANIPTHVETSGVVQFSAIELDGDRHLRVCVDGKSKACIVAECIPDLPAIASACAAVSKGDRVTVAGISRWDAGRHRWRELNPVLELTKGAP